MLTINSGSQNPGNFKLHNCFVTIHPFFDGNGRVGRILLPLMLDAEGYPPVYLSGYLKDNQREYYDTLAGCNSRGNEQSGSSFSQLMSMLLSRSLSARC
ncbi:Fic family protein [Pelotalea chapellei]|uniref:Fic family protein n=1 Tax=Pelotalea chapellei TaxID=44671 RepID=A0ABS5U695_9BACT|nr:Fic family protein [Pelotalea chapellei]